MPGSSPLRHYGTAADVAAVGRFARSARLHGRAGEGGEFAVGDVGDTLGGCWSCSAFGAITPPRSSLFEEANRAYFAVSITDRGDEFTSSSPSNTARFWPSKTLGCSSFMCSWTGTGTVGRFNLYDLVDGTAEVGYRVAEQVAGRGVATSTLRKLCRLAPGSMS